MDADRLIHKGKRCLTEAAKVLLKVLGKVLETALSALRETA